QLDQLTKEDIAGKLLIKEVQLSEEKKLANGSTSFAGKEWQKGFFAFVEDRIKSFMEVQHGISRANCEVRFGNISGIYDGDPDNIFVIDRSTDKVYRLNHQIDNTYQSGIV